MLEGEFNSMNELYRAAPNLVPKPYGWGQLTVFNPKTYYYLCDFIEFTSQKPDPVPLCKKLVALHKSSMSPNGMFGFHLKPPPPGDELESQLVRLFRPDLSAIPGVGSEGQRHQEGYRTTRRAGHSTCRAAGVGTARSRSAIHQTVTDSRRYVKPPGLRIS